MYNLTLSYVHVIWMLKLVTDLSFYCRHFEFFMMIPLDGLFNISSGFGQNCKIALWMARKFDMLKYPDHLQNWSDICHHLLIFLILAAFWLNETGQICDFRTFSWEYKGGIARKLTCWYVSWPSSEVIRFWSRSVDFPRFGIILT